MNVDSTDREVTCVSLFSGGGALELGVRRVVPNLRVVAYVEIEAYACALLEEKISKGFLDEAPIFTDVTRFPAEEFRDKVHLVIAGYPCQDFSFAGKRAGLAGNRGKMWGFTRAVVSGLRARAFFGENVEGHLSLGFDTVVSDLGDDGFVVKAGLYSAFEVGAPHLRKRIFSLSFRSDPREAPWNQFERGNKGWRDLDNAKLQALTTGRVDLADPPGIGHKRSSRPDEGGPPDPVEGCGDGDGGSDVAHTEHYGDSEGSKQAPDQGRGVPKGGGESLHEGGEAQAAQPLPGGEHRGSAGDVANDKDDGHGGWIGSGGDPWWIPDDEGEEWPVRGGKTGGGGECDGELAHTDHRGSGEDRELPELRTSGVEQPPGYSGEAREGEESEERQEGLVHTHHDRLRGEGDSGGVGSPTGKEGGGGNQPPQTTMDYGEVREWPIRWPARPGFPQYDWEAPRVVGYPEDTGCTWSDDEHEEEGTPEREHALWSDGESSEEQEAESNLGRESDAVTRGLHANRIDRLRMLGNCVVWLTAAKAFSELLEQHIEDVEDLL